MNARENILARVRQALRRPSPTPHWEHEPIGTGPLFELPTAGDLVDRFARELKAVMGTWIDALANEARAQLAEYFQAEGVRTVLALDDPLIRGVLPEAGDELEVTWIPRGPLETTPTELGWQDRDVGVTTAETLVAESGTILVTAADSGRALSVLPPIHLVVARESQIVPGLPEAFARLREKYPGQPPSMCCIITGPSRTADIEKILVLGAHGPKKLVVVLQRGC